MTDDAGMPRSITRGLCSNTSSYTKTVRRTERAVDCEDLGIVHAQCPRQESAMRFLILFRAIHNDFRLAEFLSVLACIRKVSESSLLEDIGLISAYDALNLPGGKRAPRDDPLRLRSIRRGAAGVVLYGEVFAYVTLKSEAEAFAVAERCILIRAIFRVAAHGTCYNSCKQSLSESSVQYALGPLLNGSSSLARTFRVVVESFGRHIPFDKQLERMNKFSDLLKRIPGKVRLRGADEELWILEDAFPEMGHDVAGKHGAPRQVLFGRKVGTGCASKGYEYSLKKRVYIGPTSMDAELSFIMANMGHARKNSLIIDPFAGTGSVLVACSALGALVIAADISMTILRGKGEGGIHANFKQYDLGKPVAVLRADAMNCVVRDVQQGIFDAIVCDPPYGIKEGAKAFREEEQVGIREGAVYYQGTERVRFGDVLKGLLEFAAQKLVDNGRLVYWLPTTPEYTEEDLPTHEELEVLFNCEQPLTMRMSRRLITMKRKPRMPTGKINGIETQCPRRCAIDVHVKEDVKMRKASHFDLAAKVLMQPQRDEGRLKRRDFAQR